MREIKFRAWDGERITAPVFFWGGKQSNGLLAREFYNDFHDKWVYGVDAENVVLEQFTGLLDKNGIEIYEGDIVTWGYGETVVRFGTMETCDEDCNEYEYTGWLVDDCSLDSNCEVIGNIHENPGLVVK